MADEILLGYLKLQVVDYEWQIIVEYMAIHTK